jgi:hypothetical protein
LIRFPFMNNEGVPRTPTPFPLATSALINSPLAADWRSWLNWSMFNPIPSGNFHYFLIADLLVVLEKLAVKGPEFILLARSQGGHGSTMCKPVIGEREVLDHIIDVIGKLFQHLLDKTL